MSWIDFRKLRESVSFKQVLAHYKIELRITGDKATGYCPLPTHKGERRSPSFSVELSKRIFQCFGCGAKGNLIDFVCYMEGKNPRNGADVHQIAMLIHQTFLETPATPPVKAPPPTKPSVPKPVSTATKALPDPTIPVVINAPLDFELKELDPDHPYLLGRGFTAETINHFGLGFCNRGTFKGRVVIPLHDLKGRFLGYCGRITSDKLISPTCPKYKFPPPREHERAIHELRKSHFLYNGHRIKSPVQDLIVVEGFPSVWWLWQHGHTNTVSVMGAACSSEQAQLIIKHVAADGHVWVFTDDDEAGLRCGESLLSLIAPERFVRWLQPIHGTQPTDCNAEHLAELLPLGTSTDAPKASSRTRKPLPRTA